MDQIIKSGKEMVGRDFLLNRLALVALEKEDSIPIAGVRDPDVLESLRHIYRTCTQ